MGERNREPVTKEQFRVEPSGKPDNGRGTQKLRQTPPPFRGAAAHAGRDALEETPLILDPKLAVKIERRPSDSAEIPVITANTDPLMMDTTEFREFMRKAEYLDNREKLDPNQFANGIRYAQPKNERNGGARYIAIMGEDGNAWRLYPQMENLASMEKFEKCIYRATIRVDGKDYQLYWETPELKQK